MSKSEQKMCKFTLRVINLPKFAFLPPNHNNGESILKVMIIENVISLSPRRVKTYKKVSCVTAKVLKRENRKLDCAKLYRSHFAALKSHAISFNDSVENCSGAQFFIGRKAGKFPRFGRIKITAILTRAIENSSHAERSLFAEKDAPNWKFICRREFQRRENTIFENAIIT